MDIDTFDFDEWAALAKSAPNVFEQRRIDYIEQLISDSSNVHRLHGLQCRIDMERMRARTAMRACLRISSLMWDSFFEYQSALDTFIQMSSASKNTSSLSIRSAQIINFRRDQNAPDESAPI
jgi:hypothetical protein